MRQKFWLPAALAVISSLLVTGRAVASVIPVGIAAFGAGSTLTTFDALASGVEVNGLVVNGLAFQSSLGDGALIIDDGPGSTNNLSPQNIVSVGDNTGTLTVLLPTLTSTFGYGYAILADTPVAAATTIALYRGATALDSLSFTGVPDPDFTGGFAGIQSTLPFDRVQLFFNSTDAPAFAADDIRTIPAAAVPEPATVFLLGAGLVSCARRLRDRAAPLAHSTVGEPRQTIHSTD